MRTLEAAEAERDEARMMLAATESIAREWEASSRNRDLWLEKAIARAEAAEADNARLRGLLAECYSQTGHLLTSDFADEVRSAALAPSTTGGNDE